MFGKMRFLGKKKGQQWKVYFRNKKLAVKTATIVGEESTIREEMKRIFGQVELLGYHKYNAKRG